MNKLDYQKRSRELKLDLRCPLIGRCERWALTIYINSYYELKKENISYIELLKKEKRLTSDFDDRAIKMISEFPEWHQSYELRWASNICPEIILFTNDSPAPLPKEAISSYILSVNEGLHKVSDIKHKHFSECLEFIQYKDSQQFEEKPVVENRTINTGGGDYQENNLQSDFGIGVNQGEISDKAKMGGVINEEQPQDLAEAAKEIQRLLDQLSKTCKSETKKEKKIFTAQAINLIEENPSLTQKLLSAVKAGSVAALESMLNHPAASFIIAALEDLEES